MKPFYNLLTDVFYDEKGKFYSTTFASAQCVCYNAMCTTKFIKHIPVTFHYPSVLLTF